MTFCRLNPVFLNKISSLFSFSQQRINTRIFFSLLVTSLRAKLGCHDKKLKRKKTERERAGLFFFFFLTHRGRSIYLASQTHKR